MVLPVQEDSATEGALGMGRWILNGVWKCGVFTCRVPCPPADGREAGRGEGPIQNLEAGGDLKVQGEEDPIPEREAGGPGARPKPGNRFGNAILFAVNE